MIYALYTIHIAISLFLIMVVLLQSGRSADLSALGGGATQTTFGARGATNLLHRLTVVCFVLFIVTTLTIGIFQSGGAPSVMGDVENAPAAEAASSADDTETTGAEATEQEGQPAITPADDGATQDEGATPPDANHDGGATSQPGQDPSDG